MFITAEQIRAALGALKWSRRILHERSGVNERTIQRIAEAAGVPSANSKNIAAIVAACEKGDEQGHIEFINSSAPGIRFHRRENKTELIQSKV